MLLRYAAPVEDGKSTFSSTEYSQVKHPYGPSIPAFRAGDPGSNPGRSTKFAQDFNEFRHFWLDKPFVRASIKKFLSYCNITGFFVIFHGWLR